MSISLQQGRHAFDIFMPCGGLSKGIGGDALLERWLMGTHQGAVSHDHLDYYLDEYAFRFNRRTSRYCGKLFSRLIQQAVGIDPVQYSDLATHMREPQLRHNT